MKVFQITQSPKLIASKLEDQKVSHALEKESYRTQGITNDLGLWIRSALNGSDREPAGAGNPGKRPETARNL